MTDELPDTVKGALYKEGDRVSVNGTGPYTVHGVYKDGRTFQYGLTLADDADNSVPKPKDLCRQSELSPHTRR